jgi:hypothetical protein
MSLFASGRRLNRRAGVSRFDFANRLEGVKAASHLQDGYRITHHVDNVVVLVLMLLCRF